MYGTTQELRSDGDRRSREGVREAVRFGAGILAAAATFLVVAAVWVGTCSGSTIDTAACGTAQRTLLGIGAALILLAGGAWALCQAWRRHGAAWPWHGCAAVLLMTALLVVDVGFRITAAG